MIFSETYTNDTNNNDNFYYKSSLNGIVLTVATMAGKRSLEKKKP